MAEFGMILTMANAKCGFSLNRKNMSFECSLGDYLYSIGVGINNLVLQKTIQITDIISEFVRLTINYPSTFKKETDEKTETEKSLVVEDNIAEQQKQMAQEELPTALVTTGAICFSGIVLSGIVSGGFGGCGGGGFRNKFLMDKLGLVPCAYCI